MSDLVLALLGIAGILGAGVVLFFTVLLPWSLPAIRAEREMKRLISETTDKAPWSAEDILANTGLLQQLDGPFKCVLLRSHANAGGGDGGVSVTQHDCSLLRRDGSSVVLAESLWIKNVGALPPGSLSGNIRLTEQGETISQKYANLITAEHNLELLLAGTAGTLVGTPATRATSHHLEPLMDELAGASRTAYERLLDAEGFIEFFRQATPIDVIEHSRIGSRPARRTGRPSVADLRAIPWVFSWSQSRFLLSGWYGLGTALTDLRASDEGSFDELVAHVFDWPPLHYIVSNAATAIATADAEIMGWYADLVAGESLRAGFLDRIRAEHARTVEVLELIYGGPLQDRRPNIARTLQQRDPALRPLHRRQIELIGTWRRRQIEDPAAAESMLPQLLVTVNAIASGLGTTG